MRIHRKKQTLSLPDGRPLALFFLALFSCLLLSLNAKGAECEDHVKAAQARFKDIGIYNQKTRFETCTHSRGTAYDNEGEPIGKGFCERSWDEMRGAANDYIKALATGCLQTNSLLATCKGDQSSDEHLECARKAAETGKAASDRARKILDDALTKFAKAEEKAKRLKQQFDDDVAALDRPRTSAEIAAENSLRERAMRVGLNDLTAYRGKAEALGFEQQFLLNQITNFRDVANVETEHRLSASRALGDTAARNPNQPNNSTISGGGGPGERDPPPKSPPDSDSNSLSHADVANANILAAQAANAMKASASNGTSSASSAFPGQAAALPFTPPSTAKKDLKSKAGKTGTGAGTSAPTKTADGKDTKPAGDASIPANGFNGAGAFSGFPSTGLGKDDASSKGSQMAKGIKSFLGSRSGSTGDSGGAGEANAGKAVPGARDPASEKGGAAKGEGAGGWSTFGGMGGLGPSTPMLDDPALTSELLAGLGDPGGLDGGLTEEERKWLGMAPGDPVPDLKAAKEMFAERGSHAAPEIQAGGIAGSDSPGLFFRVKKTHLRAQKRGILQTLPKPL